jgi:hypothetical protein
MVAIMNATPPNGCILRLEFSDGLVGDVDCAFRLVGGFGAELRNPDYFREVTVDPELRTAV